jgi:uncharacterized protein (TIGR00730 family)
MPVVRLSGTVSGKTDPKRKERAELLYHLFATGWDIYNGNGDQSIHLENIQKKIIESDAFVFTANPNLEDYFNLTSIFVGFQTLDGDLNNKPAIIINSDKSWNTYLELLDHLHGLGTVKEKYENHINVVDKVEDMVKILDDTQTKIDVHRQRRPSDEPDFIGAGSVVLNGKQLPMPKYNICVFCSASIKKEEYLDEGYLVGKMMAERGWGCISGAGKTGIMGQVVKGAYENGGWSGGSNVPHIIRLEGLPDGLNEFWPRGDIYTRMEVMIQKSDAFVIMPGGMGTVQELLALLILKHHDDDLMRGKKIIIYNKYDKSANKEFWQPVIQMIKEHNSFGKEFEVVESVEDIFKKLES